MAGLIATCAAAAGTEVEVVPVPPDTAPVLFPLVRREPMWPGQQRSPLAPAPPGCRPPRLR